MPRGGNHVKNAMLSIRRTFLPKLFLLIIVFILCIFYIRNLNSLKEINADRTKQYPNNLPQQQRLIQQSNVIINQLQEPEEVETNHLQLVKSGNDDDDDDDFIEKKEMEEERKTNKKINKYELEIQKDFKKQQEDPSLGADGKIAHLTDPDDIADGEKQLKKIALNEALSEHISYNRTIPDARHPACKKKSYDLSTLPTASVVIIFFNEPYSVLVRTAHSVLNSSPKNLLKEVIVVDDGSSNVELKHKLDYYVKTRFNDKVKVLRLKNR